MTFWRFCLKHIVNYNRRISNDESFFHHQILKVNKVSTNLSLVQPFYSIKEINNHLWTLQCIKFQYIHCEKFALNINISLFNIDISPIFSVIKTFIPFLFLFNNSLKFWFSFYTSKVVMLITPPTSTQCCRLPRTVLPIKKILNELN